MYILGLDIGGTKCSAVTAEWDGNNVIILKKVSCKTDHSLPPPETINTLFAIADEILIRKPDAIGISCGGPLDSERGIIMSPPNLPEWDNIEITALAEQHFGVKAKLQNDANAGALAEWSFGAGRGCQNMIFMTFGTGLGGGLIMNGKLYEGTNGNAGEVGHLRLAESGPVGYGKQGSFEGFCSGGGIAQLGYTFALEALQSGKCPSYFKEGSSPTEITAKSIADAARLGDETAMRVFTLSGEYLGRGISILIDLLNPEVIVIGSIFARCGDLLSESMQKAIERDALPFAAKVCRVVPAALGENIGDYAAIAVAIQER
jgi:glucokinase